MFVAGAVEVENDAPGRLRLAAIKDFSTASLHGFVTADVAPDAKIKTDGWPSHTRAPTSSTSPMSSAPWRPMPFCPGSTGPSPTPRPGRSAYTDCEDSISRATSMNSPSASIDSEPAMPPSAHFSQSPSSEGLIPKALLADSWGDFRIGAMLIQDGMEGSRHAISGPIARGLFG